MNSITDLTPQQLRQAADVQEKIQELQNELNQLLGAASTPSAATTAPETPGKRHFTAAAKARMAQAQRERWAKIKGTTPATAPKAPQKKPLNDARLAALAKAREARWAKVRAAKKGSKEMSSGEKPAAKKSAAWRKALSASMKASWAARRAGLTASTTKPVKKSQLSAARLAGLAKARAARWAKAGK